MRHQKYSLSWTKVLGFVACRVTSKVLGIGEAERSWGDIKTIKSGKISAIISDVSEKQSIIYTCIESAIIKQYNYDKQLNENCSSLIWNEEDDAFDQQLEKWGVKTLFSYKSETAKIELRSYIEDWGEMSMKKNDQGTCTWFLDKYGWLSLYDIYFGNRCYIDDEDIHFVKRDVYALIGNPDHPDRTSTDHGYLCIHDDFFDRVL